MRFTFPRWTAVLALLFCLSTAGWAQQPTAFFKTDGPDILDPSGNPVVLKGVGLGGWLVPEGYMLHIAAPDGGSPRSIRAQIEDLIGPADTEQFYALYEANYVDEKDIATIAAWGFDHIRLPFHYKVFFDPDTGTFIEEGFALLDTFLDWCRTYGVYVILDMHAAPGAQNSGNISDSDGVARLWTEPDPYQDQTVAIWTEIARRYVDEPLIIGYDLINEPVTPDGVTTEDLFAFYERLAEAIRDVDANHILFIEGNYYATTFLAPEDLTPFDDNMVYTFHKYWNGTALNSIQYLLDIRTVTNVPLWLGETGENSNPWFHAVTRLMEEHGIGVNWWTHKKIKTTTSPLSAPFAPGYEAILDYWRGNSPRPTPAAARDALFAMAEGLDLDSCDVRPGVLAALFDPDYRTLRVPFKEHVIPGSINAADYDLGTQGVTYQDSGFQATTGSPGGGNNGAEYRNDGVDIERSTDPEGFAYNVGWMETLEWLTYTVEVEATGRYDIEVRVASAVGGGRLRLLMDDERLGEDLDVVNTGGWQSWRSVWLRDVELTAGTRLFKLLVRSAGANVNRMRFVLVAATATEPTEAFPASTRLLPSYPNPFIDQVRVPFESDRAVRARLRIYDVLGRAVHTTPWRSYGVGEHTLEVQPTLAPGTYLYQLFVEDGQRSRVLHNTLSVTR